MPRPLKTRPSVLITQSCLTLCDPHGLQPTRLLCPWGFSRQEYRNRLPFPSPGDLPDPGVKPRSPALQADSLPSEPPGKHKAGICINSKRSGRERWEGRSHDNWSSPGLQVGFVLMEGQVTDALGKSSKPKSSFPMRHPLPAAPHPRCSVTRRHCAGSRPTPGLAGSGTCRPPADSAVQGHPGVVFIPL